MSDLRSRVIRLAHAKPELRPALLPLLKEATAPGDAAYMKALDNLSDLAELTENAQEIIDGFNLHYASGRVAGMDPQIASEYAILTKVIEGQKLADQTVKAMENLVKLFPEETKYAKALADARKMLEKLAKQVDASKKIIRTFAKKVAPKALTDLSKKIEAKIKSRLVDPSQVETFFTQSADYQGNVESFFVVKALVGGSDLRPAALWVKELVTGTPGITMSAAFDGGGPYGGWEPATVEGALETFLESVKGWKNVKGEAESQSARSGTAKSIASAIDGVTRRLSSYGQDAATVSSDFRRVEGAYRSSLPKEGAYSVGEYRYDRMVQEEISRARKSVDAALAPYKSQIANVRLYGGESWIYIEVTLK
jgi:hypothetical protein